MTDGPLLWFLNRGTGIVLLALLTVSVLLGLWSRSVRAGGRVPGFVTPSLHRSISMLGVALLAIHVVTAVADEYVDIRWWHAFVPVGSAYEPLWVGVGALSLDLIVAVVVTSVLRDRLGHRSWWLLHRLAFAAWTLGAAHGLAIGTDTAEPWARWTYVGCIAVVALAWAASRSVTRQEVAR